MVGVDGVEPTETMTTRNRARSLYGSVEPNSFSPSSTPAITKSFKLTHLGQPVVNRIGRGAFSSELAFLRSSNIVSATLSFS